MEASLVCPVHGERPRPEWRRIRTGVPVAGGGTADVYVHQRSMCREWAIAVDSLRNEDAMMARSSAAR